MPKGYHPARGKRLRLNILERKLKVEDLTQYTNIGPVLADKLQAAGISSMEELEEAGSIEAMLVMGETNLSASANMLFALEGAIRGVRWHRLPEHERQPGKNQNPPGCSRRSAHLICLSNIIWSHHGSTCTRCEILAHPCFCHDPFFSQAVFFSHPITHVIERP